MATEPQSTASAMDDDTFPDAAEINGMRETADRWQIQWADSTDRITTLVGLAWYAREFDPMATVTPVSEQ